MEGQEMSDSWMAETLATREGPDGGPGAGVLEATGGLVRGFGDGLDLDILVAVGWS